MKNTVIYNVCNWSEVEKVPWKTVTLKFNLYTFTMQYFQNFSHGLKVHWIFFSMLVWFWFSFFSSRRKIKVKNVHQIENSSYCWHFFLKPFTLGNKKNQTQKYIKLITVREHPQIWVCSTYPNLGRVVVKLKLNPQRRGWVLQQKSCQRLE